MAARIALRCLSVLALAVGLAGLALAPAAAQEDGAEGHVVLAGRIEGVINPVTAGYVDRLVTTGERRGVAAVVFTIDTPGGLIASTFKITSRMLTARIPVVTYVAPSGARAASAGTFITMAGHVAAMAPATNIGAAHPVDASGGNIEGDLRDKVENDAVAEIRKIADARGRNADWAEQAVRESVSITDATALELRVIDLVARDQAALLAEIDGRSVTVDGEPWTIATAAVEVEDHPFGLVETILHFITNPQVAILLFTIGTYGIIFELSNPSLIFPGVVGVIAIILALFAFGSLDANAAGVALMAFAVLMFLAEVWVTSHGILTVGGVAALILGILLVFPAERPTFPGFRYTVDPMTFIVVVGMTVLFFGLVLRASMRYVHLPTATGTDLLVGRRGIARSDLRPSGIVNVGGEDWTAESEGEDIPTGATVRVRRVDGVRLIVAPDTAPTGAGRGA